MPTIISPGHYRYDFETGKYNFAVKREPIVWGCAYRDLGVLLAQRRRHLVLLMGLPGSGKTTWANENGRGEVFFDATNLSVVERRTVIALGAGFGAFTELVFLHVPFEVCLARNGGRTDDRKIPESVMVRMQGKLEEPDIDFENLLSVRWINEHGCVVQDHVRPSSAMTTAHVVGTVDEK